MREPVYVHDREAWFTLQLVLEEGYALKFKAWEITAFEGETFEDAEPLYGEGPDHVTFETIRTSLTKPPIEGQVKWDGCSSLYFSDDEFHFCSKGMAKKIGLMIERVYDEAKKAFGERWQGG